MVQPVGSVVSGSSSQTTPSDQIGRMAEANIYQNLYCRKVSRFHVGLYFE